MSSGYLRKALSEDRGVVISVVDLTPNLRQIIKQLQGFPASFNHLGQACLGAVLLQSLSDTDDEDKLELQWQNTGPFGNLYADALGTGKIRGTIQNIKAEVDSLKVSMGKGLLQVRRQDKKNLKSTGIVESEGWVSQDLKKYLEQSEQKTCEISFHVGFEIQKDQATGQDELTVASAFGFIISILPADTEAEREKLLQIWDHRSKMLGPLSEWALPGNPEESTRTMLEWLTVGSKSKLLKKYPVEYFCTCSEDRIQRALSLLSPKEKKWLLSENHADQDNSSALTINCEFCGKNYHIQKTDLEN